MQEGKSLGLEHWHKSSRTRLFIFVNVYSTATCIINVIMSNYPAGQRLQLPGNNRPFTPRALEARKQQTVVG